MNLGSYNFSSRLRAFTACSALAAITLGTATNAQTPPERTLKETLRIDGNTELFSSIGFLFISRSGTIVVPSQKDNQLILFAPDGKRRGAFGQRGKGPGEFLFSVGSDFGWTRDTLWIYDTGNRRVTFMSEAGKLLRTEPLSSYTGENTDGAKPSSGAKPGTMAPQAMTDNGTMIMRAQFDVKQKRADSVTVENKYLAIKPGGLPGTSVLSFPAPTFAVSATVGGLSFGARAPFQPRVVARSAPHGAFHMLASVREANGAPVLDATVYSSAGAQLYKKSIPVSGVQIPKTVLDSAVNAALKEPIAARDGRATTAQPSIASVRKALEPVVRKRVPKFYPPLVTGLVTDDGTIWVKLVAAEGRFLWQSISNRGISTASVTIPREGTILHANGDTLWVSEKDADDVPSLVRYLMGAPARK